MATRYWVGNGGNWSDTSHWSTSSGGVGGASVPTSLDDVYFDANSFTATGQTVMMNVTSSPYGKAKNLVFTGVTNSPTLAFVTDGALFIYESLILSPNMTVGNGNGEGLIFMFGSAATHHITTNGVILGVKQFAIDDGSGYLEDNFVTTGKFAVINSAATFSTQNFNLTAASVDFHNQTTLGSSIVTVNPTSSVPSNIVFSVDVMPALFNAGTSTININLPITPCYFYVAPVSDGVSFNNVNIIGNGSGNILNFDLGIPATYGDFSVNNLTISGEPVGVGFHQGMTLTASSITANGSLGNLITFRSTVDSTQYTLTSGTNSLSFVDVKDSVATGGIFDNSIGGVDSGNNTGWLFPSPPIADFSADVTTGTVPLTVTFTDTSTGSPTSWLWDFKNDGEALSTEQNPVYIYAASGTYAVKLTVTNPVGTDSITKTSYITVSASSRTALVFKDSDGTQELKFKGNGLANPYSEIFDGSLQSADRTYKFPNLDGTIALLESLSAVTPLSYDSATGEFSIAQAGASADGYLSQADWNTFNNKENVLSFTSPLDRTGDVISLKDLSGFGTPGQVIKTNGAGNGLEWGPNGSGDFMADGSIPMTGNLLFDTFAGGITVQTQTNPGNDGGPLLLTPGLGYDFGGATQAIQSVSVNTGGTGYTYGDLLTLTAGDGNGVVGVAATDGGIIDSVAISLGYGGSGYTVNDQVTLLFYGAGDAVFNVDSVDGFGAITGLSIVNAGTNYHNETFLPLDGGTGTGARVDILQLNTVGAVSAVWIDSSGTGYSVGTSAVTGGTGNDDCIINIDSIFAPTPSGQVGIVNPENSFVAYFDTSNLTSNQNFAFPDASGTFALESAVTQDIVVGAQTLHFTNGILTSVT